VAVRNLRTIQPKIWIPPSANAAWKVEVVRSDGTTDDITNSFVSLRVEDYVTDSIGSFEFMIYDPNGVYFDAWTGNEIFYYYKDYAATATTLRFRGRLEKPSKRGHKLLVKGRGESLKIMNVYVTASYSSSACSDIITDLISKYADWATTGGIEENTTELTVNWSEKPLFECIQEVCTASGYDFYINADLEAQFFLRGSRENNGEAMLHDYNLFEISDYTPDFTQIRNKVRVYGAEVNGSQVIYTSTQSTGDYGTATLGVREEIVRDDNITSYEQAKDVGDAILADKLTPPTTGEFTSFILATLAPGEKLNLSSPADGVAPGLYTSVGYKDEINLQNSKFTTTAYINKTPRKITSVLRDRIIQENRNKSPSTNPYSLDHSYSFSFNTDSGTHNETEISERQLRLQSGQSSGFWVSPMRELDSDISEAYLFMNGSNLNQVKVSVSGNNGSNYKEVSNGKKIDCSTVSGKNLVVKVEFTAAGAEISGLSVVYT